MVHYGWDLNEILDYAKEWFELKRHRGEPHPLTKLLNWNQSLDCAVLIVTLVVQPLKTALKST